MNAHIFEDMTIGKNSFRADVAPKTSIGIRKFDEAGAEFKPLKNFKVGDEVVFSTFWVSSDGPFEGYTHKYMGTIKSITRLSIIVSEAGAGTKRLNFKEFVAMNWQ
jgi:hypothetical protein